MAQNSFSHRHLKPRRPTLLLQVKHLCLPLEGESERGEEESGDAEAASAARAGETGMAMGAETGAEADSGAEEIMMEGAAEAAMAAAAAAVEEAMGMGEEVLLVVAWRRPCASLKHLLHRFSDAGLPKKPHPAAHITGA